MIRPACGRPWSVLERERPAAIHKSVGNYHTSICKVIQRLSFTCRTRAGREQHCCESDNTETSASCSQHDVLRTLLPEYHVDCLTASGVSIITPHMWLHLDPFKCFIYFVFGR